VWAYDREDLGGPAMDRAAERACIEAIEYALEGDPAEYDSAAEAVALDVQVTPAAGPGTSSSSRTPGCRSRSCTVSARGLRPGNVLCHRKPHRLLALVTGPRLRCLHADAYSGASGGRHGVWSAAPATGPASTAARPACAPIQLQALGYRLTLERAG